MDMAHTIIAHHAVFFFGVAFVAGFFVGRFIDDLTREILVLRRQEQFEKECDSGVRKFEDIH